MCRARCVNPRRNCASRRFTAWTWPSVGGTGAKFPASEVAQGCRVPAQIEALRVNPRFKHGLRGAGAPPRPCATVGNSGEWRRGGGDGSGGGSHGTVICVSFKHRIRINVRRLGTSAPAAPSPSASRPRPSWASPSQASTPRRPRPVGTNSDTYRWLSPGTRLHPEPCRGVARRPSRLRRSRCPVERRRCRRRPSHLGHWPRARARRQGGPGRGACAGDSDDRARAIAGRFARACADC